MVSYTLSKAEDSISDFISSPPQDQGRGRDPQHPDGLPLGFDPSSERGPSLQDQRHRFAATAVQELPCGLQASGIFTAGSGRPYNIIAGPDLNGDGDATVSPGPDRARRVLSDPSDEHRSKHGPPAARASPRRARHQELKAGPRSSVSLTLDVLNLLNATEFTDVTVCRHGRYRRRQRLRPVHQAGPPRQLQIGRAFVLIRSIHTHGRRHSTTRPLASDQPTVELIIAREAGPAASTRFCSGAFRRSRNGRTGGCRPRHAGISTRAISCRTPR